MMFSRIVDNLIAEGFLDPHGILYRSLCHGKIEIRDSCKAGLSNWRLLVQILGAFQSHFSRL